MIRPPSDLLRNRKFDVTSVIGILALAWILPSSALLIALSTQIGLQAWQAQYQPHIYIDSTVEPNAVNALVGEIQAWPEVRRVHRRSPKQAMGVLADRLGTERIQELNITPAALPRTLVLEADSLSPHSRSLLAKTHTLESRPEVVATDLPSAQALSILNLVEISFLIAALLFASLLLIALVQTKRLLESAHADERHEFAALEAFGAPSDALRRSTYIRGFIVGAWAGGIGFLSLMGLQLLWSRFSLEFLGFNPQGLAYGVMVFVPLVGAPALSHFAAWLSIRTTEGVDINVPMGTRSLLKYASS